MEVLLYAPGLHRLFPTESEALRLDDEASVVWTLFVVRQRPPPAITLPSRLWNTSIPNKMDIERIFLG